mmetsp:Transcript_4905/g.16819  ORF Transcript_4905/g.16819 Transcript_4905/m.16819 type:complete len:95 (+) Transcript_4905:85-369(+)
MTTTTNTIHSKSNFLTEYEKERNARVMRNELLMRRLGLSDFDSHMHRNASSSKNKREEEDDSSDEKKKKKNFLGKIVIFDRIIGETESFDFGFR